MPVISIIIVTFNAAKTVGRALESVVSQNIDKQIIVIDGASTDSTMSIVGQYADNTFVVMSEPDQGIYDAMNKGIDRATGDWLYFLGADDQLMPGILEIVDPYLNPSYKIIFGDVLFSNGHYTRSFFGPRTLLQNTVHHQSAFYHRSLFLSFQYDSRLEIIADYELNLLIYCQKLLYKYIPQTIATCAVGGASSQWNLSVKETNQVRKKYVVKGWENSLFSYTLRIYYLQKQIRAFLYGHQV